MAGQEKRSGGPRMTIETNNAAASGTSQANSARAPKPAVEAASSVATESSEQAAASKSTAPKPKVKVQQPPQPQPMQTVSEEPRQEPTVVQPADGQAQAGATEAASSDTSSPDAGGKQPQKPRMTFSEWVHKTFPGHENAFYGAMLALLVAALVFIIGVWRTLLLVVLVIVGIAIGQVFDGNPKIINAIRGLFESDRTK